MDSGKRMKEAVAWFNAELIAGVQDSSSLALNTVVGSCEAT
jgi:hypothetical protein